MKLLVFLLLILFSMPCHADEISCDKQYGKLSHPSGASLLESIDMAELAISKQPTSLSDADFFLDTQLQNILRNIRRSIDSATVHGKEIITGESNLARLRSIRRELDRAAQVETKEPSFLHRISGLIGKTKQGKELEPAPTLEATSREVHQELEVLTHLMQSLSDHENELDAVTKSLQKYDEELKARLALAKTKEDEMEIAGLRSSAANLMADVRLSEGELNLLKRQMREVITQNLGIKNSLEANGSIHGAPLVIQERGEESRKKLLDIMESNPNSAAAKMAAVEYRHYPKKVYLQTLNQWLGRKKYSPQLKILLDQASTMGLSAKEMAKLQESLVKLLSDGFTLDTDFASMGRSYLANATLTASQKSSMQQAFLYPGYSLNARADLFRVFLDHASPTELTNIIPSLEKKEGPDFLLTISHLLEERRQSISLNMKDINRRDFLIALEKVDNAISKILPPLSDVGNEVRLELLRPHLKYGRGRYYVTRNIENKTLLTSHRDRPQTIHEIFLGSLRDYLFHELEYDTKFNEIILENSDSLTFTKEDVKLIFSRNIYKKTTYPYKDDFKGIYSGYFMSDEDYRKFIGPYHYRSAEVIAASRSIPVEQLKKVIVSYSDGCAVNIYCLIAKLFYAHRTNAAESEINSISLSLKNLAKEGAYQEAMEHGIRDPYLDRVFLK